MQGTVLRKRKQTGLSKADKQRQDGAGEPDHEVLPTQILFHEASATTFSWDPRHTWPSDTLLLKVLWGKREPSKRA